MLIFFNQGVVTLFNFLRMSHLLWELPSLVPSLRLDSIGMSIIFDHLSYLRNVLAVSVMQAVTVRDVFVEESLLHLQLCSFVDAPVLVVSDDSLQEFESLPTNSCCNDTLVVE